MPLFITTDQRQKRKQTFIFRDFRILMELSLQSLGSSVCMQIHVSKNYLTSGHIFMKFLKQLKFISPIHLSIMFHKNNIFFPRISGRDFHRTGPGSINGHYMWNLWWTTWHCDRFFSVYFGINYSTSLYHCSITIFHSSNMMPYTYST